MSQSSSARRRRTAHAERASAERFPAAPSDRLAERYPPLARTYTVPGVAILPLRLFLGLTFVYAGLQKLTDPGFFHAGSPTYIGAQLQAFSRGSPIAFLLHPMAQQAVAVGALTIVTEIAVGLAMVLGLLTRPAALIGLVLNLTFFLSASWHTYPYFYGSDIVFVMCWLTIILTGPGPFALDQRVEGSILRWLRAQFGPDTGQALGRVFTVPTETASYLPEALDLENPHPPTTRRVLITRGEALLASVVTLGLVLLGLHGRGSSAPAGQKFASSSRPVPTGGSTGGGGAQSVPAGYTKIGNISQLPVNSAGSVSDPKTGDPVVVVHTTGTQYYAYDAVCTHAGCTVEYDPSSKMLVCPCHGGAFDPTKGAEVVAGPPPSPLTPIPLKIDAQGNIYIV